MDDRAPRSPFPTRILAVALALSCVTGRVAAKDATPFAARGGLELASTAAQS